MRIQKYLSEQKILSRREAEEYMKNGLIACNGEIVRDLGRQIDPTKDVIKVLQPPHIAPEKRKITIAVYKPRGIVSSKVKSEGKTIFELLPQFAHLNTVGRLDKESEGLLLLSNDGTVTAAVTSNEHIIEKEYIVTVREKIEPWKLRKMEEGMVLEDGPTLPTKTKRIDHHTFTIILKEGRTHQIRRMAAAVHLTITNLVRTRIGGSKLGSMKPGAHRVVTLKEIQALKNTTSHADTYGGVQTAG